MLTELDKWISTQSQVRKAVLLCFFVAVISALDFLTGYEISFSIFYLIPISFSGWYLGKRLGVFLYIISASIWLGFDLAAGHPYSHMAIPFWNAFVRLGFFVIVVVLLGHIRDSLEYRASLAEIDGLTGILNARTFKKRCDTNFLLSARNQLPVTLAYIDLDGFKGVNDSLGHSVGDQVLIAVAEILATRLRASDVCARLGGDEFSILLPDTNYAGAQTIFTGLHLSLLELAKSHHWPVGFSIGVAVFQSPVTSPDQAIQMADALMYQVKESGKNSIRFEEYNANSRLA